MSNRRISSKGGVKTTRLAIALILMMASAAYAQAPNANRSGDMSHFGRGIRGEIAADFSARVWSYFDLRSEVEKGLAARRVTADPAEITKAVRALAERIRVARVNAKQGDFFTPAVSMAFRKALLGEMSSDTWAAIMDDNPGELTVPINGSYPDGKPLSTVPPNVLALLPRLPEDVQYRFVGRDLILFDMRANLILDQMPQAIQLRGQR